MFTMQLNTFWKIKCKLRKHFPGKLSYNRRIKTGRVIRFAFTYEQRNLRGRLVGKTPPMTIFFLILIKKNNRRYQFEFF